MEISMAEQTAAFLWSIVFGMAAGMWYGAFSAVRMLSPNGRWLAPILDLLYFFLLAVTTFLFFFAMEDGTVRGYLYAGELFGWLLWQMTAGKLWEKGLSVLFRLLRKACRNVWKKGRRLGEIWKKKIFKKHEKTKKIS